VTENDTTVITVDDLPVEVDAEEYNADPEYVIRKVREERAATALGDDVPEAGGFDE
jgi:hypothetical protein